jgi:hypothetical protein
MTSRSDELDWFLCGMVSKPLFSAVSPDPSAEFTGSSWIDSLTDEVHDALTLLFNKKES